MNSKGTGIKSALIGFSALATSMLPFTGFPEVVISEIMAKNDKCLATKSGFTGIDWIELLNTGSAATTNFVMDITGALHVPSAVQWDVAGAKGGICGIDDGSGSAVVGALEAQTNEPQLFILGIGQAAE